MKTCKELYQEMLDLYTEKTGFEMDDAADLAVRLYAAAAQLESLYAYLEKPQVAAGDGLERGAELGRVRGMRLYYEMRKDGQSIDPSQVQGS